MPRIDGRTAVGGAILSGSALDGVPEGSARVKTPSIDLLDRVPHAVARVGRSMHIARVGRFCHPDAQIPGGNWLLTKLQNHGPTLGVFLRAVRKNLPFPL